MEGVINIVDIEDKTNNFAKPIFNFTDLLKDIKMDAIAFKEKYGIPKEQAKGILDSLWLDQLATFGKEFEVYEDYRKSDFSKSKKEVEIFEPGYHNGTLFTEKDIDMILENTKKMMADQNMSIPIKLGHSKEQSVAKILFGDEIKDTKGMPALGWVENLKKKGNKIVCDLVKIPDKLFDMLKEHYYDPRSIELWNGFVDSNGKTIGSVITGLALLGAEQPAVTNLGNMFDKEGEAKLYFVNAEKNKEGDDIMSEVKKETVVDGSEVKTETETVVPEKKKTEDVIEKEVEKGKEEEVEKSGTEEEKKELAKKKEKTFDLKQFANEDQVNEALMSLKKKADEGDQAIKDLAEFKNKVSEKERADINEKDAAFLAEMEKKGVLLPFQTEILKPLLEEIDVKKEVKYFDKKLDVDKNVKLKDLVVNFIKSLPNQVLYQEFTKTTGSDLTTDLHAAAKKYSMENSVDLGDAYKVVAKELGRQDEL